MPLKKNVWRKLAKTYNDMREMEERVLTRGTSEAVESSCLRVLEQHRPKVMAYLALLRENARLSRLSTSDRKNIAILVHHLKPLEARSRLAEVLGKKGLRLELARKASEVKMLAGVREAGHPPWFDSLRNKNAVRRFSGE